jgi:hypothetical protein
MPVSTWENAFRIHVPFDVLIGAAMTLVAAYFRCG